MQGIRIEEDGDVSGSEGRPRIKLQDAGARQQERPRRERTSARTAGSRSTRYKAAGAEWHSGNRTGGPLTEELNQSATM